MGAAPMPKESESPLHVAIIGAGIGGLALAIGLLRQGVPYTLYEAAGQYAAIGAGVGLGPNSIKAMDMIDTRFRGLYDSIKTGNLTPGKEHVMSEVWMTEPGFGEHIGWKGAPWGSEIYLRTSAHRKALLDIMTSLIPLETVKFNKRVESYEQHPDKIVITFSDGEVVESTCVVAADGVSGPSRKAVLGEKFPDQVNPTYTHKYIYRSIVPMDDAFQILGHHAGDAKMFMGLDCNFACYPISKGTEHNIVAFKRDEQPWTDPELTREVSRDAMMNDFPGVDDRLVQLLKWAKPTQWGVFHHLTTPTYYNGRLCLLGDVAHATTPHQASGAGQGLEDALILSYLLGEVKSAEHVETAFRIYDEYRRPRAQGVCETSLECGKIFNRRGPGIGDDMAKIAENLNRRFAWIWEHDLEEDVRESCEQFRRETGEV